MASPDRPWKQAVFSQFLRAGDWIAPDGVAYMGYAVRAERNRYVEWRRWPGGELAAVELYDLASDPRENENLAARPGHEALLRELAAMLEKVRNDPRAFNARSLRGTS